MTTARQLFPRYARSEGVWEDKERPNRRFVIVPWKHAMQVDTVIEMLSGVHRRDDGMYVGILWLRDVQQDLRPANKYRCLSVLQTRPARTHRRQAAGGRGR